MSRGGADIYIFIMHFLNDKWESYCVIIKVFETSNTSRCVMALKMNDALRKSERNNLSTMNYVLILFCEVLGLLPDY
jgi:hypothetical protein